MLTEQGGEGDARGSANSEVQRTQDEEKIAGVQCEGEEAARVCEKVS